MATSKCSNSYTELPFDCLVLIFKYLPFYQRVTIERVCRTWREASIACNASNQISLCIFSKKLSKNCPTSRDAIQPFCSEKNHKISFENDCVFAESDENLLPVIEILSKCPSLKALHFKCYEEESLFMEKIGDFYQLCPRVEHLSISDDTRGCYIYKDGLSLIKNCTKLRHLQIRFPAEGTLDFLLESVIIKKALLMHIPTLEIICTNLPLNNEHCELIANSSNLNQLLLTGTSSTLEGLTMICTSPVQNLKVLNIVIDWNLQLNLITDYLINLIVLNCTIASSEVTNIRSISKLHKLESLFLSVWPSIELDDDIIEIMNGCCNLKSLTINGEVGDTSLVHIGLLCPKLEKLEIALNNATTNPVSDVTVTQGLTLLKNLKYLSLQKTIVSDLGVRVLLECCTKLTYLQLTGADKLTLTVFEILEEASEKRRKKYQQEKEDEEEQILYSSEKHKQVEMQVKLPSQLIKPFGQKESSICKTGLKITFA